LKKKSRENSREKSTENDPSFFKTIEDKIDTRFAQKMSDLKEKERDQNSQSFNNNQDSSNNINQFRASTHRTFEQFEK